MEKINLGIIGVGKQFLKSYLPVILKLNYYFELKALCDINIDSLVFDKKINIYDDYRKMISTESLDCLILTLPHNQYLKVIKYAIKTNRFINILQEKPLSLNIDSSKELLNIINKSHKGVYMISSQKKFNPLFKEFKNFVLNELKNIQYIKATYTIPSNNPNFGWRSKKEMCGGGVLLDMGYHIIDLLFYIFNTEIKIKNSYILNTNKQQYDVEDLSNTYFEINKIQGAMFISCIVPDKKFQLIFIGENGSALFEDKFIKFYDKNNHCFYENKIEEKSICIEKQLLFFYNTIHNNITDKLLSDSILPKYHYKRHMNMINNIYNFNNNENRKY